MMIYGSVCSGVEAASVAWEPLGWKPAWFCEFDKFPSAVLAHHYPDVPNLHDMTEIESRKEYNERSIDILVGGTPCQSFSIAGLRKGLDDDRGNLALQFCRILKTKQPRWFVWENVPGVVSSNGGNDLAAIFSGFRECGYSIAYRILDSQYFGVAQRRRRIFVIGYLGNWQYPAKVLFERNSLFGDIAASQKEGQGVARTVAGNVGKDDKKPIVIDRAAYNQGENALYEPLIESAESVPSIIARGPCAVLPCRMVAFGEYVTDETASTLKQRDYKDATDLICYPIHDQATRHNGNNKGKGNGLGIGKQGDPCPTLTAGDNHAVFFHATQTPVSGNISPTLGANSQIGINQNQHVRRLTPVECERLQGFPDNWTNIPWRGKKNAPDGPRYKAMGNSMTVPVMHWIGKRIQIVDSMIKK